MLKFPPLDRPNLARAAFLAVLFLVPPARAGADWIPQRRRSQFRRDSGWVIVPFPYNLPGIGSGLGVLGGVTNIAGSCADFAGAVFGGKASGTALGVDGIELIRERLLLDVGMTYLRRVGLQNFSKRGMNAGKNDFTVAEFRDAAFDGGRLTTTFLERRLEFYGGYYFGSARLNSLRDKDGRLIADTHNAPKVRTETGILGGRLSLTDDYLDPRKGLQFEPSFWRSPPRDFGPDYYFVDAVATAYVPVGRRSTWAVNYLRSDAHVRHPGELNRAALESNQGLDCGGLADPDQRRQCEEFVDSYIAENTHGSASSLGGLNRLRSYPEGRFKGAHTEFVGTELRWNLTDEVKPFNIYVMKDVRTTMQIAFFYELATIADRRSDLWKSTRASYGTGFRMITASGLVYRVDIAGGHEGFNPTIFFQYPWQL